MGIYFTEFIYNKSMLGFMGIYGKLAGDVNPHTSEKIYGKPAGDIYPHKSKHGSIINKPRKRNPHNP